LPFGGGKIRKSPVFWTSNGQGQKVVKNFKKEGERERVADKNTWFLSFKGSRVLNS